MTDIMTPAQRSERMSRIRSRDTKPEMLVRRFLHGKGFRFRLHVRDLPGRPDLVLPKYGAVEEKHQLTLAGLADVDAGRTISHEEMKAWVRSMFLAIEEPD